MAIKSSGSISFSEISQEFGSSTGGTSISLGKYRVSQTFGGMQNMPLDQGIPQSGAIGMSDFYSKRLNIVVNYYSGGTEFVPNTGRQRYQATNSQGTPTQAATIGGFTSVPKTSQDTPQTAGRTVWLHINKTIGGLSGDPHSEENIQKFCSFKSGNWQTGTKLYVQVGPQGKVYGKGGRGGSGGDNLGGNGENGRSGASAIGIQYTNAVASNPNGKCYVVGSPGSFAAGGGAGGGGGGAGGDQNIRGSGGGAGGGGAGLPPGKGAEGGVNNVGIPVYNLGQDGSNGTTSAGGASGNSPGVYAGGQLRAEGGNAGEAGNLGEASQGGQAGKVGDKRGNASVSSPGGNWLRTAQLSAGSDSTDQVEVSWQGSGLQGGSSSASVG